MVRLAWAACVCGAQIIEEARSTGADSTESRKQSRAADQSGEEDQSGISGVYGA